MITLVRKKFCNATLENIFCIHKKIKKIINIFYYKFSNIIFYDLNN